MTGVFRRKEMRDKLLGDWIDAKSTTPNQFIALLKNWKKDIFEPDKFADAKLLRDRLNSMSQDERDNLSVILFLSPQALRKETEWTRLLMSLAAKDYISVLCVDEAHSVNIYESFRPEFKESIQTLKAIYEACNKKPTRIVMSATMRVEDQQRIDELWGASPDFIVWTEMNRHRIFIDIVAER